MPYVLENGIEISVRDDRKGETYGTITFAAPVIINEKRGNIAVMVKQTKQSPPIRRESPETGSLATAKDSASQDTLVNKDTPGHRREQPLVTAPNISIADGGGNVN